MISVVGRAPAGSNLVVIQALNLRGLRSAVIVLVGVGVESFGVGASSKTSTREPSALIRFIVSVTGHIANPSFATSLSLMVIAPVSLPITVKTAGGALRVHTASGTLGLGGGTGRGASVAVGRGVLSGTGGIGIVIPPRCKPAAAPVHSVAAFTF